MKKIKSPVLFDANILMNFKGQLKFICGFFENILVHKKVLEEILEDYIREEINEVMEEQGNVTVVEDTILKDEIEKTLFKECDKELRNIFNIDDLRDLGEYKTLLYAKFNGVSLLSSQDTTIWRFIRKSTYFNEIECITMQDISYLIYLNANNKHGRKLAKSLYTKYSREEHSFNSFKCYMHRQEDKIPKYIEFENNRIDNFNQLVKGYLEFYSKDIYCNVEEVEGEVVHAAKTNPDTCISCLYSRMDSNNVDYNERICILNYQLFYDDCLITREEFSKLIKKRAK